MGAGGSSDFKRCVSKLNDDELKVLEDKFTSLKNEGISGPALISKLCEEIDANKASIDAADAARNAAEVAANSSPLAESRARVRSVNDAVTMDAQSNFLVGTDGAKPSELALDVCVLELMKDRDSLLVLHASDPKRSNFFSPSLKAVNVKEKVENTLKEAALSKDDYKLMWIEKKDDENIKTCVMNKVNDLTSTRNDLKASERPNYFVTGITGRRGENTVGKLVLLAVKHFHIPNIVIKIPPVTDRPRVFVAAIKRLDRMEPVHIAMDLMKPSQGDKLIVLHVYSDELEDQAVQDYASLFKTIVTTDGFEKSGSLFIPVKDSSAKTWRDEIFEILESHKANYFLMNPAIDLENELLENETMENCKQIIQHVNCNVVICND